MPFIYYSAFNTLPFKYHHLILFKYLASSLNQQVFWKKKYSFLCFHIMYIFIFSYNLHSIAVENQKKNKEIINTSTIKPPRLSATDALTKMEVFFKS